MEQLLMMAASAKECTHPMNLEEPDTSCLDRSLNLLPVERVALVKADNRHLCRGIFFKFLVVYSNFLHMPTPPSPTSHAKKKSF